MDYKEPQVYDLVNDDPFNHEESPKQPGKGKPKKKPTNKLEKFTLEDAMYRLHLLKRPESDFEVQADLTFFLANYRKDGHISTNNDSVKHFIFMLAFIETKLYALDPAWRFE